MFDPCLPIREPARPRRRAATLLAASLVLTARPASADELLAAAKPLEDMTIEELLSVQVTTIATTTRKPIVHAPSSITVITAADIEAMGATTVEEALESVPGLHVSYSGPTYRPKYLIRGVSSRLNAQVLLMIDGVPVTSVIRGGRGLWSNLPVAMVSRIEVIRGPGSAVWGADALTGVINVVTKTTDDLEGLEVGALAGSFKSGAAHLLHGSRHGDLDLFLGAFGSTTDGQRRVIEADTTRGSAATLAPGPVNLSRNNATFIADLHSGRWRLFGSYQQDWNEGTGQGIANALDPHGRGEHGRGVAALTFDDHTTLEGLEIVGRATYFNESQQVDEDQWLYPPGTNLGAGVFPNGVIGNPEYWEQRVISDLSVVVTRWEGHRLRLGAGYLFTEVYRVQDTRNYGPGFTPMPNIIDVSGTSADYSPRPRRHGANALVQEEWTFADDWELTLGARFDYSTAFGGAFDPRAALVWRPSPHWTGRLFYGRAFRAPAEAELTARNNPATTGNPTLGPERIDVFEANVDYWPAPELHASLTGFHNRVRDLIDFVPDAASHTNIAQNVGEVDATGFEVEVSYRPIPALRLVANYSYQSSVGEAPDVPKHKAYGRLELRPLEGWLFTPQVDAVGARSRRSNDPRERLDGYVTVDLVARRLDLYGFDLSFYVKNLLDADVREPSIAPPVGSTRVPIPGDLPQAGRSFFGEVSYRF